MIGILAAASVGWAAAPPVEIQVFRGFPPFAALTACRPNGRFQIVDPALLYRRDGRRLSYRLGELPKANHEKAVLRTVDGCAAPLVVGYDVGR